MKQRPYTHYLFSIILIILGIGWLLDNLDVWNFWPVLGDWWPAFIILAGALSIRNNPRNPTGPAIVMLIGLGLLLQTVDAISFNVFTIFWPILIIVIGLLILLRRNRTIEGTDSDTVRAFVIFSGTEKRIISKQFKGGEVTAIFGGAKIDLRECRMAQNAAISVFAAFGGADIIVPKTCKVVTQGTPLFGGFEDKTSPDSGASDTLLLKGTALFGGVDIKN